MIKKWNVLVVVGHESETIQVVADWCGQSTDVLLNLPLERIGEVFADTELEAHDEAIRLYLGA